MGALLSRDRLRAALLASLVLHAFFAYLLPGIAVVRGPAPAIETLTYVRALPILIQTPRPLVPARPALAPVRAPAPRIHPIQRSKTGAYRALRRVSSAHVPAAAAPIVASHIERGALAPNPATATPVPTSTARAATVASVETRNDVGGYMPLGASVPVPVLDPNVRDSLQALGIHVTLLIVVDASGHTKDVVFQPPLDDAMQSRIRSMLASATWDPAICGGGIACQAKMTIRL